jgi:hypothetical protein
MLDGAHLRTLVFDDFGATQACYTGQNAGLQKALFCWVFRLGQVTGGEGGIRTPDRRRHQGQNLAKMLGAGV